MKQDSQSRQITVHLEHYSVVATLKGHESALCLHVCTEMSQNKLKLQHSMRQVSPTQALEEENILERD